LAKPDPTGEPPPQNPRSSAWSRRRILGPADPQDARHPQQHQSRLQAPSSKAGLNTLADRTPQRTSVCNLVYGESMRMASLRPVFPGPASPTRRQAGPTRQLRACRPGPCPGAVANLKAA
jgi:hypothetical protein